MINLVSDGRNKYSVPYDLIGHTVDLRLTRNLVEVYYNGARVAVHVRHATAQRDPIVKPEHMLEAHKSISAITNTNSRPGPPVSTRRRWTSSSIS